MKRVVVTLFAFLSVLPGAAFAATALVSPIAPPEGAVSFDVSGGQVRYDLPNDRFYIQRTIFSLTGAYESVYGSLGYIDHTDYSDIGGPGATQPSGDPGYLLAFGARGALWRRGSFSLNGDFQYHYMNEKAVVADLRYSMRTHEVLVGAATAWEGPTWHVYMGFDAVPYSTISTDIPGLETMERSDFYIVHFGGSKRFDKVTLDADVQVLGAEGLRVGMRYDF